jgi:hypothetical protein
VATLYRVADGEETTFLQRFDFYGEDKLTHFMVNVSLSRCGVLAYSAARRVCHSVACS